MTDHLTELEQMLEDALAPDVPELHAWLASDRTAGDVIGGLPEQMREPEDRDEPPPWEIDGERTAAWCARRLTRAEAERAAAKAEANRLRALAAEYEDRVARRTERTIGYFTDRLRAWHDGILAEQPRRLTVDLPGFQLKRRAGAVSTEVTDPEALTAWLTDRDDDTTFLDYPDPSIKKKALKDTFAGKVTTDPGTYPAVDEATGEVVPGVTFIRAVPSETLHPVAPVDAEGKPA